MPVSPSSSSEETAKAIADEALMQKLAGCILRSNTVSTYMWENKKQDDNEVVALFKTTEENLNSLESFILQSHQYDTPVILKVNATANHK